MRVTRQTRHSARLEEKPEEKNSSNLSDTQKDLISDEISVSDTSEKKPKRIRKNNTKDDTENTTKVKLSKVTEPKSPIKPTTKENTKNKTVNNQKTTRKRKTRSSEEVDQEGVQDSIDVVPDESTKPVPPKSTPIKNSKTPVKSSTKKNTKTTDGDKSTTKSTTSNTNTTSTSNSNTTSTSNLTTTIKRNIPSQLTKILSRIQNQQLTNATVNFDSLAYNSIEEEMEDTSTQLEEESEVKNENKSPSYSISMKEARSLLKKLAPISSQLSNKFDDDTSDCRIIPDPSPSELPKIRNHPRPTPVNGQRLYKYCDYRGTRFYSNTYCLITNTNKRSTLDKLDPEIVHNQTDLFHPLHPSFTLHRNQYLGLIKHFSYLHLEQDSLAVSVTVQLLRYTTPSVVALTDVELTTNASFIRNRAFVLNGPEFNRFEEQAIPPLHLAPIFLCKSRQIGKSEMLVPLLYNVSVFNDCVEYITELVELNAFDIQTKEVTRSDELDEDALDEDINDFSAAHNLLDPGSIPVASGHALPCREHAHSEMYTFLKNAIIRGNASGTLFVSGMPGTGKTATLHQVVRKLQQESDEGLLSKHSVLEINATQLNDPSVIYSVLWNHISNSKLHPAEAEAALNQYFNKQDQAEGRSRLARGMGKKTDTPFIVLIIDELDYLINKSQNVLYQLVEWPGKANSRIVTVGISNTFDLPERLVAKVQSRVGLTRLAFEPYTHQELINIVVKRLEKAINNKKNTSDSDNSRCTVFKKESIELCARKVAATSGDVRRVLAICRKAIQIATNEGQSLVSIQHIEKAVQSFDNTKLSTLIKSSAIYDHLFLAALYLLQPTSFTLQSPNISVSSIYNKISTICRTKGIVPEPTIDDIVILAERWFSIGILEITTTHNIGKTLVKLDHSKEDIGNNLKQIPLLNTLIDIQ